MVENLKNRPESPRNQAKTAKTGWVEKLKTGLVENSENGLVENQSKILEMMIKDPTISKQQISESLGISSTAVDKNIDVLKKKGLLKRVGPDKGGHWKVIKSNN